MSAASPFGSTDGAASPASRIVSENCSHCFGRGIKYQYDYYGNPTSVLCATCSGMGTVTYELPVSSPPQQQQQQPSGSQSANTVHLCSICRGSGIQHQSPTIQCLAPYGQHCYFCALCAQCGGQGVVQYYNTNS